MNSNLNEFRIVFKAPEGSEKALELMTTEQERSLLLALKDCDSFNTSQVASVMAIPETEATSLLKSCYKRGIVSLTEEGNYVKGELYCRLDLFAQFEHDKWSSLSYELRHYLDDWYVEKYGKRCIDGILGKVEHRIKSNYCIEGTEDSYLGNDIILPLEEALTYLDGIEEDIYLLPCNCRCIAMNCDKPVETCIQYNPASEINTPINRGWGRKISKDEAREIMKKANAAGLMQTVGDDAICNCDGCCCYPSRSSQRLNSQGIWPRTKYRVQWNDQACIRCGLCVKRCNFNVFEIVQSDGKRFMKFDSSKCRGCGLCVESCPKKAISLEKI